MKDQYLAERDTEPYAVLCTLYMRRRKFTAWTRFNSSHRFYRHVPRTQMQHKVVDQCIYKNYDDDQKMCSFFLQWTDAVAVCAVHVSRCFRLLLMKFVDNNIESLVNSSCCCCCCTCTKVRRIERVKQVSRVSRDGNLLAYNMCVWMCHWVCCVPQFDSMQPRAECMCVIDLDWNMFTYTYDEYSIRWTTEESWKNEEGSFKWIISLYIVFLVYAVCTMRWTMARNCTSVCST